MSVKLSKVWMCVILFECFLIYQRHVWILIVIMLTSPCSYPPTPQPSPWQTVCCRGAVYAIIGWLIGWRAWRRPWFIRWGFCTEPMTTSSDDDSLTSERWSRGGLCLAFTPTQWSHTHSWRIERIFFCWMACIIRFKWSANVLEDNMKYTRCYLISCIKVVFNLIVFYLKYCIFTFIHIWIGNIIQKTYIIISNK